MKIAIITDAYYPQSNGVVTVIDNLVNAIHAKGDEVIIIHPDLTTNISLPFYKEIKMAYRFESLKKHYLEFAPDVTLIMTEFTIGKYFKKYCKKHNIKYYTWYHTNFHLYFPFFSKLIIKYITNFHKDSAVIFTSSRMSSLWLEANGILNTMPLKLGVNSTVFQPNKKFVSQKILLYVGRVAWGKNLQDFLKLNVKGYSKIIVGRGPLLNKLKKKYQSEKCIFKGYVPHEKLQELYAGADVLVFPSTTDTFGLVMLEAMACGTPVAAYPVMGPKDVIIEGVNGSMDGKLNRAVIRCLSIDREKCAESVKDNDWSFTYEKMRHLFEVGLRVKL